MFQAQNLFVLKQQKLTLDMSIGIQLVLLVLKNQSWILIRHLLMRCHCYCNRVIKKIPTHAEAAARRGFPKMAETCLHSG
jgi:hypothetical protein